MKKSAKKEKENQKKSENNSNTKKTHDKTDRKPKAKFAIIAIVLIAVIILGIFFFTGSEDTKVAYLSSINGNVEIQSNGVWNSAKSGQEVFLNDVIRTSQGSSANLVILGKAIINIEESTEVEVTSLLEDNIQIKQNSGSTWSKFLGLVGAKSYSVQTPDAVASVRGTEFGIDVEENSSIALVGEGVVSFGSENESLDLTELEKAGVINNTLQRLKLSDADLARIQGKKQQVINNLKSIREEQLRNLGPLVTIARKTYGLTDEDVREKLDAIDRGEINDEELIEKAPFRKDDLRKIKRINDEIKKTQNEIERINSIRTNASQN